MKPLEFMGSSLEDLRDFPARARQSAGFELYFLQQGLQPSDWKPMTSIAPGVVEIRIHRDGEWRVIYVASFRKAVYVLHAFEKRTRKARQTDIDLARKRYQDIKAKQ